MHAPSPYKRTVSVPLLVSAVLCFTSGIGLFIYLIFSGMSGLTDSLLSARMPGEVKLKLTEPGSYTVFHEYSHQFEDGTARAEDRAVESMQLALTDSSGKNYPLQKPSGESSYSLNGREGYSMYWFEIQEPGDYTLVGTPAGAESADSAVMFTLANNYGGRLLLLIGKCFAALVIPSIAGLILLILAFLKKKA